MFPQFCCGSRIYEWLLRWWEMLQGLAFKGSLWLFPFNANKD